MSKNIGHLAIAAGLFVVAMVVAALVAGCHFKPPTQAETGAIVQDCAACGKEVAPIIESVFSRCGTAPDGGARDGGAD